jgi:hypothetical protein
MASVHRVHKGTVPSEKLDHAREWEEDSSRPASQKERSHSKCEAGQLGHLRQGGKETMRVSPPMMIIVNEFAAGDMAQACSGSRFNGQRVALSSQNIKAVEHIDVGSLGGDAAGWERERDGRDNVAKVRSLAP